MAKTYDIGDSPQIAKLRNSTIADKPAPNRKGAAHFGATTPDGAPPPPPGAPADKKPNLAQQIFPNASAPSGDFNLSNPGAGEAAIGAHLNDAWNLPNNSQGLYAQGAFNTPTASENFYGQNAGQFQAPGAAENWFAGHSGQFDKPGAAEDFYSAHKGDLANMPGLSNHAEEAYQHTRGNMPDIASDPGLDPYYKHAAQVGTQNLNTQLAARGAYGSSVGTGQIGNLLQGLGAEQANREAQYHLDRLAEQRGWEGLQGQLASGADSSSGRIHDAKLSDLMGFGNLAQSAGQSSLSRLLGASGAASAAQGAQTARLSAGTSAAGQASDADIARQGLAAGLAGQSDSSARANLNTGVNASQALDSVRGGRIQGAFNNVLTAGQMISGAAGRNAESSMAQDYQLLTDKTQASAARYAAAHRLAEQQANGDAQTAATLFSAFAALIG